MTEHTDGIHEVAKRLRSFYAADPDPYGLRVLDAIDKLRRDLTGYHGQLKAHSDLQIHCDRQRERIACLEGLYAKVKAENAELRDELTKWERLADGIEFPEYPVTEFQPKDLERENAKLRELVRYMWLYDYAGFFTTLREASDHREEVYQRIRELGIEVE